MTRGLEAVSDIAELENGLRQSTVETSRGIVPGSNVSSSYAKEPAIGPIAAVATGAGMGVRQLLAVNSQAGRLRQPRQGAPSGRERREFGLGLRSMTPPLHLTGSIRKSTERMKSTGKPRA
jgi:hypothetical protein